MSSLKLNYGDTNKNGKFWDPRYPDPFHNHFLPIYKLHQEHKKHVLDIWIGDSLPRALTENGFEEFYSARLNLSGGQRKPVISFVPHIPEEDLIALQADATFIRMYKVVRKNLIDALFTGQVLKDDPRIKLAIKSNINLLKLLLKLKNTGFFNPAEMTEAVVRPTLFVAHPSLRVDMIGSVVGDGFMETGQLYYDHDQTQIQAWKEYAKFLNALYSG